MILRPYQPRAVDALRLAYQRGRRAPCLVAPCGYGKTIVAAHIMASATALGTRTLFVADRCTLIDQTEAKLRLAGLDQIRIIQADRDEGPRDALVTVASAQTLRMPSWVDRLPDADLVIWDECHGVKAKSYEQLLRRYPRARWLGCSATPCRSDNKPLDMFDELVVGATTSELIEQGYLAPPWIKAPGRSLDGNAIARTPLDVWQSFAGGRRAALFCADVASAQRYVAEFIAAGVSAEVVTADTPDRAGILRRFAGNEFLILASVGTLTQGWDDPECSVAIVERRCKFVGLWLQICGRVLRSHPGKEYGLILDLRGNAREHGSPAQDREYSLTGKAISSVAKDSIRQCIECGSIAPTGPSACPYCGAGYPRRERPAARVTGDELIDVDAAPAVRREYGGPVTRKQTRDEPCSACRNIIRRGDQYRWYRGARRAVHIRCPLPAVPARAP